MVRKALLFVLLFLCLSCKESPTTVSAGPPAGSSNSAASVSGPSENSGELRQGDAMEPFTLTALDGTKRSLSDFKGKVVLLNLWATWCVPCIVEMPSLERLYKTLKPKGFEIVAISVDPPESLDVVKKFVAENGITFTILHDPELTIAGRLGVSGFPESFFIDDEGRFLSVIDPETKAQSVRILSDRPWDSMDYIGLVEQLLQKNLPTQVAG